MANAIRALAMDAVQKANSGHPGMVMGMADIATILYSEFLQFNPHDPKWPGRDRLVLSAGHGSMLLYALFYLTGYNDINIEDLKNFRTLHAKTAGHPEFGLLAGIETTTGPLGQGLANAVGMAISQRKLEEKFGKTLAHHKTYVICGDGCLMEGISQEAISLAGHLNLSNLIVIFDDNNISIDGATSLTTSDDHIARVISSNWNAIRINGHDSDEIRAALFKAGKSDKPTLIACKTKIGYGSPAKEGSEKSHGSPLGENEIIATKKNLNWEAEKFVIPQEILDLWRTRAKRCDKNYQDWQAAKTEEFEEFVQGNLPANLRQEFLTLKEQFSGEVNQESTRKSSGNVIEFLTAKIPNLLGGSADLSESNNTKSSSARALSPHDFSGNYIYYGIREHAMVAIMNGVSLYGLYLPFGGSFLVFTDYARPAIRLAAIMKRKIILLMTHDSIGLGEDGPTHQPIEHLASLRAIPNLYVFRPADKIETLECWQNALELDYPSIISLSRQNLPYLREKFVEENLSSRGAYVIKDSETMPKVTIFATGSELQIALSVFEKLEKLQIAARVVSVPCWELFDSQDAEYKKSILSDNSIKLAIEAGSGFGWEKFIGRDGIFIGMSDFGASAPAEKLYEYFKITADEAFAQVMNKIQNQGL